MSLTHLDETGAARMVDVGDKEITRREARAECVVHLGDQSRAALAASLPKGDAIAVARLAGIMGAKRTADLIPLCHPLPLTSVAVEFEEIPIGLRITATARVSGRTGVEMEALTAVSIAGLTIIDMLKAVEKGIEFEVRLLEKSGGRSGTWTR